MVEIQFEEKPDVNYRAIRKPASTTRYTSMANWKEKRAPTTAAAGEELSVISDQDHDVGLTKACLCQHKVHI